MKKTAVFFAVLFAMAATVFAQQAAGQLLDVETSSQTKGKYSIGIEYTPLLKEARVYCAASTNIFDEGTAINVVMEVLKDFAAQKGLGRYEYYTRPVIRNDNEKKITYYIVSVSFKPL